MEIKTDRLVIKPYTESNEKEMLGLLTNAVIKETYMIPNFQTKEEAVALFRKLLDDSRSGKYLELGIYCDDRLIGFLNEVDKDGAKIELGYVIHPDFHGRGYATEALEAVIEELFCEDFREVIAGAFENNEASIRVMAKCGMSPLNKTEDIFYRGVNRHCVYYSIKKS